MSRDIIIKRSEIEVIENWRDWNNKIPQLNFKESWNVKILAPYMGVFIRFTVSVDDAFVSVYLDVHAHLGGVGEPYWEIYPFEDDVMRVLMNETDDLMMHIQTSLNEQLEKG